mmetsp:Transcript_23204/g.39671  ORF Transcript_23204/g.39671 Transcript_23204/m.39671 type:complete len:80 (+) Transcript_23204:202-441(+)
MPQFMLASTIPWCGSHWLREYSGWESNEYKFPMNTNIVTYYPIVRYRLTSNTPLFCMFFFQKSVLSKKLLKQMLEVFFN